MLLFIVLLFYCFIVSFTDMYTNNLIHIYIIPDAIIQTKWSDETIRRDGSTKRLDETVRRDGLDEAVP